jgi:diphosphomevalonate decarboxylase
MNYKAAAQAHSNIALIKYWGKQASQLNLPAVGSISLTLNELYTITSVCFKKDQEADTLFLNNNRASQEVKARVSTFLDIFRAKANIKFMAEVISENNFPTGAGLASSASAFAALSLAASAALGLKLSKTELSQLARLGSGSAARSIYGGFVEMKKGNEVDGSDAVAIQLADQRYWDLRLLILITSHAEKEIGSTMGMNHTAQTSPYYASWIATSNDDIHEMRSAIAGKDLEKLGELAEFNCLKMHALGFSARPALIYWNELTIQLIHAVRELRKSGLPVYFTIDAGPQVKVISIPEYIQKVRNELNAIPGIKSSIETSLGPDAKIIEDWI